MNTPFPKLAAVIFDMDGTMLDSEIIYHAAYRKGAASLGYTLSDETILATVGRKMEDCYQIIGDSQGLGFPLDAFKRTWAHHWHEHIAEHGIPHKPGLLDLFALLDAHRIPKAVATSTEHEDAMFCLERSGIRQRFTTIVTGDQIANGKPAPDIFLLAARRLGVAPEACLALEDSEAGVIAASAAGMYTILVPDKAPPSAVATQRARHIFSSLHEARHLILETWLK